MFSAVVAGGGGGVGPGTLLAAGTGEYLYSFDIFISLNFNIFILLNFLLILYFNFLFHFF
jgi:hypothetical protein